jgi:Zn-dependent oligopeptidase
MTSPTDNPLLDFSGLTPFDKITPAHVEPAIRQLPAPPPPGTTS